MRALLIGSLLLLATACGAPGDVQDQAGLDLNLKRLQVAVDDFDAIKDPPNTHADGPATSGGCLRDSGEMFEPYAGQTWTLDGPALIETDEKEADWNALEVSPAGEAAMESIARQLIARGWTGPAQVRYEDGATTINLTRAYDDHTIDLSMQGFPDGILVNASTTPENVCRH